MYSPESNRQGLENTAGDKAGVTALRVVMVDAPLTLAAAPIAIPFRAAEGAVIVIDSLGTARIFVEGAELGFHAASQASFRGVSLGEIASTVSQGARFTYKQAGEVLTGFYNKASNIFVGLGREYTTVIQPRSGVKYIENLQKRP